ncbi:MAG: hypothetical protein EOO00_12015 [Chitinophagaceae bacterium]|nr:MAG: hypothetical protein EOO00_12015 [Chitinophagaceae bacterium]
MKRFFTLAALFISMVSFAAAPPRAGRLIISNADNTISHVRVNGRLYNLDQQTIIFNNLAAGRQFLEVYRTERPRFGVGRGKLVLVQTTPLYVDPSFIVDVNINRTGRITIGKTLKIRNGNLRYYDARDGRYYQDERFATRGDARYDGRDDNRYNDRNDSYGDRANGNDRNYGYGDRANGNDRNDRFDPNDNRYNDGKDNRGPVNGQGKNEVRENRPEVLPVPVPGNGGRPVRKVM